MCFPVESRIWLIENDEFRQTEQRDAEVWFLFSAATQARHERIRVLLEVKAIKQMIHRSDPTFVLLMGIQSTSRRKVSEVFSHGEPFERKSVLRTVASSIVGCNCA